MNTWPAKVGHAARRAECGVELALGLVPGMAASGIESDLGGSEPHIETEVRARRRAATSPHIDHRQRARAATANMVYRPKYRDQRAHHCTNSSLPAFHLRCQLHRKRPRLALPQILLRPRTPSLHTTDVQIPHP
jgi:hypothetical protein